MEHPSQLKLDNRPAVLGRRPKSKRNINSDSSDPPVGFYRRTREMFRFGSGRQRDWNPVIAASRAHVEREFSFDPLVDLAGKLNILVGRSRTINETGSTLSRACGTRAESKSEDSRRSIPLARYRLLDPPTIPCCNHSSLEGGIC